MEFVAASDERIDAVYLWVDGSKLDFQEDLQKHWRREARAHDHSAVDPQHFRDNGELRYSLRSLDLYAPWLGRIHIVTNGQVPAWLNLARDRVSLVTHEQIFPDDSSLPVFNSCAIELNLHRIPGLSRRFLYLNDDIFLGRETRQSDFLTDVGGQCLYFEPTPVTRRFARGAVHERAYAHTVQILDALWGQSGAGHEAACYVRSWPARLLKRSFWRMLPAHTPQLYDREILQELENILAVEFAATRAHKFRSATDLVLRLIYFYYLLESGRYECDLRISLLDWLSPAYQFVMLDGSLAQVRAHFKRTLELRPKFLCVNDDLSAVAADHPVLELFREFLHSWYPRPGTLEMPSNRSTCRGSGSEAV